MRKYLKYIITVTIGLAFSALIIFSKDIFNQESTTEVMKILCDGFFVPGVVILGFGLLVVASNGGTFDMIVYGTKKFFDLFRRNAYKRVNETFYEYKKAKSDKKIEFLYMIITGLVFIAISIIFLVLYYNV